MRRGYSIGIEGVDIEWRMQDLAVILQTLCSQRSSMCLTWSQEPQGAVAGARKQERGYSCHRKNCWGSRPVQEVREEGANLKQIEWTKSMGFGHLLDWVVGKGHHQDECPDLGDWWCPYPRQGPELEGLSKGTWEGGEDGGDNGFQCGFTKLEVSGQLY